VRSTKGTLIKYISFRGIRATRDGIERNHHRRTECRLIRVKKKKKKHTIKTFVIGYEIVPRAKEKKKNMNKWKENTLARLNCAGYVIFAAFRIGRRIRCCVADRRRDTFGYTSQWPYQIINHFRRFLASLRLSRSPHSMVIISPVPMQCYSVILPRSVSGFFLLSYIKYLRWSRAKYKKTSPRQRAHTWRKTETKRSGACPMVGTRKVYGRRLRRPNTKQ
jgi:hypothetical protein